MALDEDEMVTILEEIARNSSNQSARISAIKELRAMRGGQKPQSETVAQLYEIGRPPMRQKRVRSSPDVA